MGHSSYNFSSAPFPFLETPHLGSKVSNLSECQKIGNSYISEWAEYSIGAKPQTGIHIKVFSKGQNCLKGAPGDGAQIVDLK